jgi:hypothetical protein
MPGERDERLALVEHEVKECERQLKAMWERLDQRAREMEEVRMTQVRAEARLDQKIHDVETHGEKTAMRFHAQLDKIKWKVGIIVAVWLGILNYLLNRIDLNKLFEPEQPAVSAPARKR